MSRYAISASKQVSLKLDGCDRWFSLLLKHCRNQLSCIEGYLLCRRAWMEFVCADMCAICLFLLAALLRLKSSCSFRFSLDA